MNTDLRSATPAGAAMMLFTTVFSVFRGVVMPLAFRRDQTRTGGRFTFWRVNLTDGEVEQVIGFSVGHVEPERSRRYGSFADEKASRLGSRPEDVSSWESRDVNDTDPMKHRYGGAIRCGKNGELIFSFSGFSEEEDEMLSALTAAQLGLLGDEQMDRIIAASENQALVQYITAGRSRRQDAAPPGAGCAV